MHVGLNAACHLCRLQIAKYSFGEATLHKDSSDDSCYYILNGQQRLITVTILLSVLRHLATIKYQADPVKLRKINLTLAPTLFSFEEANNMTQVTRIQVRQLQSDFFATYISPAADNLGSFWGEGNELLLGLAGNDTIKSIFMFVADALRKVGCALKQLSVLDVVPCVWCNHVLGTAGLA